MSTGILIMRIMQCAGARSAICSIIDAMHFHFCALFSPARVASSRDTCFECISTRSHVAHLARRTARAVKRDSQTLHCTGTQNSPRFFWQRAFLSCSTLLRTFSGRHSPINIRAKLTGGGKGRRDLSRPNSFILTVLQSKDSELKYFHPIVTCTDDRGDHAPTQCVHRCP